MAKKRGKNRRPAKGVKIGGGPIAGMLQAKALIYAGGMTLDLEIGVTDQYGVFTKINAPVEVDETNPPWVSVRDALQQFPITKATYTTTGRLVLDVIPAWGGGTTLDIGIAPNVKLLEQYPNLIFAGSASQVYG